MLRYIFDSDYFNGLLSAHRQFSIWREEIGNRNRFVNNLAGADKRTSRSRANNGDHRARRPLSTPFQSDRKHSQ
jgi:hypothetical protein